MEPPTATGINNKKAQQVAPQSITLQGFQATANHRGMTIERLTNEKGEVIVRKVMNK